MHRQHKKEGLVLVSVSTDIPEDKGMALDYLQKQKATFPNYWLNEKEVIWQEKWDVAGPPVTFVFNRQGRRAAKFTGEDENNPYNHEDVEKLVLKLLKEKP